MERYQNAIKKILQQFYPGLEVIFSAPPAPEFGHIALPCFAFAKVMKKSPDKIAQELKNCLSCLDFVERIETSHGFINFFIQKNILFRDIITEILSKKGKYGSSGSGVGKKALVEHTSINPNASPHIGRARNALIGDTIVRLLRFEGYSVKVHYFVNDIGKQIAMLLLGAMNKENVTFRDLLGIYIDINNKVANSPELEKDVFHLLYQLENGDENVRDMFRRIVNICIEGQTAILAKLGIQYDAYDYESDYIFTNTTGRLLDEFRKTGRLEEDAEGRLVLNQSEYHLPMEAAYLVLTRNDKTSLYPLRDIAYTIDKVKTNSDINIIVLGEDQKLYFCQVSSALNLLGYKAPSPVHYSFVLLKEGKMATRKGNVVLLEDFMQEAASKAYDEIKKRRGCADEATARAIGYGAVKYTILRASNDKNVVFDWETAMSFEGDSGPYLHYNLARINSIFRTYGSPLPEEIDYSVLKNIQELDLILELANFPQTVKTALKELSPHVIVNYVYGLAKKFSVFYRYHSILNADTRELIAARLALAASVKQVILNCFELLGIEPVDEM